MARIKPLQDKILLKKKSIEGEKEKVVGGGIILPTDEKKIEYAEVIDISSELDKCSLKVGDKVLYSKYGGEEVSLDDEEFLLISYKDVFAIIDLNT